MNFAALTAKANASVLKHVANVTVTIGGEDSPGIFRSPSQAAALGIGMADSRPMVKVASSAVVDDPVDSTILIDGVPYVVGACDPDGAGLTALSVECTQ